jgi:ATP-dependent DNA helicase RecQ
VGGRGSRAFDRLSVVRLEIARSRGVPPYVIFHERDASGNGSPRPTSIFALLGVKSVGARNADDLGEIVLAAIRSQAWFSW